MAEDQLLPTSAGWPGELWSIVAWPAAVTFAVCCPSMYICPLKTPGQKKSTAHSKAPLREPAKGS